MHKACQLVLPFPNNHLAYADGILKFPNCCRGATAAGTRIDIYLNRQQNSGVVTARRSAAG